MNSMGSMQTLPYRFKCVHQCKSQEYTHVMGMTRSNKPVWVVGSRAMTHSSHPWPDGLMGRTAVYLAVKGQKKLGITQRKSNDSK